MHCRADSPRALLHAPRSKGLAAIQHWALEAAFGGDLTWEPLEGKRACRIKSEMAGNIFDRDQWPAMIDFMTDAMVRMESVFREPLAAINRKLRTKERLALAPTVAPGEAAGGRAEGGLASRPINDEALRPARL